MRATLRNNPFVRAGAHSREAVRPRFPFGRRKLLWFSFLLFRPALCPRGIPRVAHLYLGGNNLEIIGPTKLLCMFLLLSDLSRWRSIL